MTASTFEDMLSASKRVKPFMGLEEFGLTLFCGSITELESSELESSAWKSGTTDIDPLKLKSARRRLIALTVCDEDGRRLLSHDQAAMLNSRLASILYDQANAFITFKPPKKSLASGGESPSDSHSNADGPTSTTSSTNSLQSSSPNGVNSTQ
jgi:hypothetical protein